MVQDDVSPALPEQRPLIKASELAQYSFCRRAWWLGNVRKIGGQNQALLARGQKVHHRHKGQVQAAHRWRKTGGLLISLGGLLFLLVLLWRWLGAG